MFKKKKGLWATVLLLAAAVCMIFASCGKTGKVKLSFDTGDGPAVESVEVEAGEEYTLPVPEWEGHSFEGWFENADRSGLPVTTVIPEKKTTFYAKWEQLYAITLQLGGGSLAGGKTVLYAKAGTNVADFMQDYVPSYADHQFGEWLVGDEPLDEETTLTSAGITLTAHYRVAYTAELYLQDLALRGYEKAEENYLGYGYVGELPAPDVKGFERTSHTGATDPKPLSENAADNHFVFYMNRKQVTVYLMANQTALEGSDQVVISKPFGTSAELPVPFSLDGYCLVGWSTAPRGEVKYRSSYIDSVLYNGTYGSDPFLYEDGTVLFAVWVQGYTDMFGSEDLIFHLSDDAETIYLLRGGIMFEGSYDRERSTFLFKTQGNNSVSMAEGKLNGDGTFSFYSDDRFSKTYTYFKNAVGSNDKIHILLDGYNGLTYIDETLPTANNESKGSYTIDEDGYYHVTYTEGPEAGNDYLYALNSDSTQGAIFMVRDEEEFGWGPIPRGVVNRGRLTYYISIYSLTLNGFGIANYANPDGTSSTYFYRREENVITLLNSYGMQIAEARLTTIGGDRAYLMYSDSYDTAYTSENGGTVMLTLDGLYNAVYKDAAGAETKGIYTLYSSEFGTLVQFFTADGKERLFLTHTETETVEGGDDGETEQKVNHLFKEVPTTYSEINYLQDGRVYYAPLLVLDDGEAGNASVYGYVSNSYIKVLTGTYTKDAQGVYTFTTKDTISTEETLSSPIDILALKSFTFSVDTVVSSDGAAMTVMYWHSMTLKGEEEGSEEKTTYGKTYTGENGATLTVTQGFGVYEYETEDGKVTVSGVVTTDQSGITALYDSLNEETYYFRLDDKDSKFTRLEGVIGTLYAWVNGTTSRNETLTFDGSLTNATYTVVTAGENGESTTTTYEGTYAQTAETTLSGTPIFEFTADGMKFKFIVLAVSSSSMRFAKFDETFNGEYTCGNSSLTLDGFCVSATYLDEAGKEHTGPYTVSEDVVRITAATEGRYYYFDLKAKKTFTVRDDVYGGYIYIKNQSVAGLVFLFDGYGKLTVNDLNADTEEGSVICADGKYEKQENGSYVLKYKNGAEDITITGWIGTITLSSTPYNAFYFSYEEVVMSFVNEKDWSVLVLKECGEATRYNEEGFAEDGQYVIVTDTLLYYADANGSYARIYIYDKAKGTISPVNNTERAYYTSNFEAMLFTRYGFMIMDGMTRYYYNVVNDVVYLYRQAPSDPEANEYGFVEEDFFGSFGDSKEIDGKLYHESFDFTLLFSRKAGDEEKYKIPVSEENKQSLGQLSFSPTGSAEFTDDDATVVIDGRPIPCTVRRVLEGEQYHMYILVPANVGNFVFEIELSYDGDEADNDYTIKSMHTEIVLYDTIYLNYLLNYMMQGYIVGNSFGVITLTTEYDESSVAGTPKANGTFGDTMKELGLTDTKGEVISFTDLEYTFENGIYTVTFKGSDEYQYSLHFGIDNSLYRYLGMMGYGIYAFTRHQEVKTAENSYTVAVERILFTESAYFTAGGFWDIALTDAEGNEIEHDAAYILDGKVYYFVRTRDEETKKITESKVYVITLKQETPEDKEEEADPLAPYISAEVEEKALSTAYSADEKTFIEYDEAHTFVFMSMGSSTYIFVGEDCAYDEAAKTFTLTTGSGRKFTAAIDEDGVVTVTEVAVEEEKATTAE